MKFLFFIFVSFSFLWGTVVDDLINQGKTDFYDNPQKAFQGFVYDAEDLNPSFLKKYFSPEWRLITKSKVDNIARSAWDKRFAISTSAFADFSSIINYYITANVLREDIFIPELTLGIGHLFYAPIYASPDENYFDDDILETVLRSTSFQSVSTSLIISKSVRYNLKIFTGYRYNYGDLKVNVAGGQLDRPNKVYDDVWHMHTLLLGITYLIDNTDWEASSYMAFSILEQDIYVKVEFSYKFLALGLGLYPNNILILKPYLRFFVRI